MPVFAGKYADAGVCNRISYEFLQVSARFLYLPLEIEKAETEVPA